MKRTWKYGLKFHTPQSPSSFLPPKTKLRRSCSTTLLRTSLNRSFAVLLFNGSFHDFIFHKVALPSFIPSVSHVAKTQLDTLLGSSFIIVRTCHSLRLLYAVLLFNLHNFNLYKFALPSFPLTRDGDGVQHSCRQTTCFS